MFLGPLSPLTSPLAFLEWVVLADSCVLCVTWFLFLSGPGVNPEVLRAFVFGFLSAEMLFPQTFK